MSDIYLDWIAADRSISSSLSACLVPILQIIPALLNPLFKMLLHDRSDPGASKQQIQNDPKDWQNQDQYGPRQFIRRINLLVQDP